MECFEIIVNGLTVSEWSLPNGSGVFRSMPKHLWWGFLSKSLFSEIKAKDKYLDKSFIQNSSIFDIYRASYGELAGYLTIANQFPV